jgi:hypothetical protein
MPKPKWTMRATLTEQGQAKDPAGGVLTSGVAVYDEADATTRVTAAMAGMDNGDVAAFAIQPVDPV